MFTNATRNQLVFYWKLAYYTNVIEYYPYIENKTKFIILKVKGGSAKTLVTKCLVFFYILYPTFILFQLIRCIATNQIPPSLQTKFTLKMVYMTLVYSIAAVHQINRLDKWNDIPNFENQFLKYFQAKIPNSIVFKLQKICTIAFLFGLAINTANLLLILKRPNIHQFITSVLPLSKETPMWIQCLLTLLQVWIWWYFYVSLFNILKRVHLSKH